MPDLDNIADIDKIAEKANKKDRHNQAVKNKFAVEVKLVIANKDKICQARTKWLIKQEANGYLRCSNTVRFKI